MDAQGDIVLRTAAGEVRLGKPIIYQEARAPTVKRLSCRKRFTSDRNLYPKTKLTTKAQRGLNQETMLQRRGDKILRTQIYAEYTRIRHNRSGYWLVNSDSIW